MMNKLKYLALAAAAGAIFAAASGEAAAQVSVDIGAAPECPYGYYDYAPYSCAPYGYYGPEWFVGGLFIGAGPWFHGPARFRGHVDSRFDARHGFGGPFPGHGERPEPSMHLDHMDGFRGNEMHDGFGHGGGEMGHGGGEMGHGGGERR
jgi:hypothetical protein